MIRAILFDFDGVVVQSELLHKKTFMELLSPWGVDVSDERWYREFAGTGSRHIFEVLVRENGIREEPSVLVERRKAVYEGYVRGGALKETAGVREFLSAARAAGLKTAIVSGSHRTNVELALSVLALGEYFDLIVSGDDLKARKPDPQPFLHAAESLGVRPDECVAIEDSRSGMLAASRAGMRLVCVDAHPAVDKNLCSLIVKDFRGLGPGNL
ncbi:MAG: HAD family phosphatase [Candidatus Micrarchaeota archaeon]